MKIIVPAYNVKPEQATRFEAQIADIMHRYRRTEMGRDKPEPEFRRYEPVNSKPSAAAGRKDTPTDLVILKLIKEQALTATELAKKLTMSRPAVVAALDRLLTRKRVVKRHKPNGTLWRAVGEQHDQT